MTDLKKAKEWADAKMDGVYGAVQCRDCGKVIALVMPNMHRVGDKIVPLCEECWRSYATP